MEIFMNKRMFFSCAMILNFLQAAQAPSWQEYFSGFTQDKILAGRKKLFQPIIEGQEEYLR
jgi:hypothetical protein